MLPIVFCFALGLAQSAPVPIAPVRPAARMCSEAIELLKNGKLDDGLKKLEEAAKADPGDPQPHDITARVFQILAKGSTPHARDYFREKAEDEAELAREAKGGDHASRVRAQALLESIHQDEFPREGTANEEAKKAFVEAEGHFDKNQFDKARQAYQKALELDPQFAVAALYIGDCYHSEGKALEAATWFRKATKIRPDYPKAWRYLSDSLSALGNMEEAESALLGGIAAHPGNRLTWFNLAGLRSERNKPMTKLAFRTPLIPSWDEKGQQSIQIPEKTDDPDGQAIWMVLVASVMDEIAVEEKGSGTGDGGPVLKTRFQQELFIWDLAMTRLEQASQEKKQEPAERTKQAHDQAGLPHSPHPFLGRKGTAVHPDPREDG